jgi:hypothetical protein
MSVVEKADQYGEFRTAAFDAWFPVLCHGNVRKEVLAQRAERDGDQRDGRKAGALKELAIQLSLEPCFRLRVDDTARLLDNNFVVILPIFRSNGAI